MKKSKFTPFPLTVIVGETEDSFLTMDVLIKDYQPSSPPDFYADNASDYYGHDAEIEYEIISCVPPYPSVALSGQELYNRILDAFKTHMRKTNEDMFYDY